MKTKRALILFSRDPLQEAVQKRLFNNQAKNVFLYQNLISHTLNIVGEARRHEAFDVFITFKAALRSVDTTDITGLIRQRGNTFAERLQNSVQQVFSRGYQEVIIVGNDCPDFSAETLLKAFKSLHSHDSVLGPAEDGGVYLIGINRYQRHYFSDINWYSKSVCAELLNTFCTLNETVFTLGTLSDMDTLRVLSCWAGTHFTILAQTLLNLFDQTEQNLLIHRLIPFNYRRHLGRRSWQKAPPPIV